MKIREMSPEERRKYSRERKAQWRKKNMVKCCNKSMKKMTEQLVRNSYFLCETCGKTTIKRKVVSSATENLIKRYENSEVKQIG